jgi:hypothetical protein
LPEWTFALIVSFFLKVNNNSMKQTPIDEVFHFRCTCCGDCCTGNMEININLYDLYKMARFLKMSNSRECFDKGLVRLVQVQNGCWTPQIVFKTSPVKFCPWLINDLGDDDILRGYCSLHPGHKPLICKMAPAGRIVDFYNQTTSYVLTEPTENCPGMLSSAENRLSDLKEDLSVELAFESRYYRILDKVKETLVSRETMVEQYYTFQTEREFEDILLEMEKKSDIV